MNSYLRHCQENGKDSNIYGSDRSGNYSETPGKHTQRKRKKYVPFYAHALQYTIELRTPGIMTTISSFSVPLTYFFLPLPYSPSLHLSPSISLSLLKESAKQVSNTSCGCALRCFDKVSGEQQQNLFSGFWDRANFNVQNAYLCGCVKVVDIAK